MGYQKHVERVMMWTLEQFFKQYKIPYTPNRSTATFTLFNGSQIIFGSSENPESLEGPHVDCAWIDEAGYMPRLAWDVATRRTDYQEGPILITSVPYYLNWLKTDLYDEWIKGDQDIDWIHCRSADNLKYSQTVLERVKRTRRPEYYEIYYEGNFARPFGLIYGDPPNDSIVVDSESLFPNGIPNDWPCYSGHDFGINNPNAGVWGRLAPDDTLYIVAEYQAPELTMKSHVERWRRAGLDNTDQSFGDPAGADQMLTAAEEGFNIEKANNDILFGVDLVYDRFKTGRLKILRGCKTLLDYRSLYVWKKNPKNEDELMDQPEKPQPSEHMMDALRYLCTGIFENVAGNTDNNTPELRIRRRNVA